MNVPDTAAAANWYEKYFGGRRITEAPDRLMFGSTRFMFLKKADAKPSSGSAIDHVGFSFANLDAKMKEFEAAGMKIVTPVRDVPGLFKLRSSKTRGARASKSCRIPSGSDCTTCICVGRTRRKFSAGCKRNLAGERTKLKGRIDAIKYGAPGFSDMWILVQKGDAEPSEGHAIDHIGWRSVAR